jgi:GDP/UDP-N,N'-diacetylbacillosamine 2-epimerase (hydrolysing)
MEEINDDQNLQLQIIATGMHLSANFGETYKEIEADGFRIDKKVSVLNASDTPAGIALAISKGIEGCANAIEELNPDLLLVLGDRFEIFAAVTAALLQRIPVAHINGGELTIGALDDALRHAITKMSHLHFVAADEYRNRVIQLGELEENVFQVGGLGPESIKRQQILDRQTLEKILGIKFGKRNLMITYHPETLGKTSVEYQMQQLLNALDKLTDTCLIFTKPNADSGGKMIIEMIDEFVSSHRNAYSFKSLGQQKYLSCVSLIDGVIGNSSSGITEVPSLKKGTVNIGERQLGRLQASSVINCVSEEMAISSAISQLYSSSFQSALTQVSNPYENGNASKKIVRILKEVSLSQITQKRFNDL